MKDIALSTCFDVVLKRGGGRISNGSGTTPEITKHKGLSVSWRGEGRRCPTDPDTCRRRSVMDHQSYEGYISAENRDEFITDLF